MGEFERGLSGSRFGWEESFRNARDCSVREERTGQRAVDARSDADSGNLRKLLARFALGLDGAGKKGAVAAQRTVDGGLWLILASVRSDADLCFGVASFKEG